MKRLLFLSAVTMLIGCSQTYQYRAIAPKQVEKGKTCNTKDLDARYVEEYTYEYTVDTTGHAWGCGLSAAYLGGWCWAYTAMPFESHLKEVKDYARSRIQSNLRIKGDETCIIDESIIEVD